MWYNRYRTHGLHCSAAWSKYIMAREKYLIINGGSIKATQDEGVVEGLGIEFTGPDKPDRSKFKDYFTPDSEIHYKTVTSFTLPLGFEHDKKFGWVGEAILTKNEDGWNAVSKLDMENETVKANWEDIKAGKFGYSTGALAHFVDRIPQENGTNFLKRWPTGEISLTKTPAGGEGLMLTSVKSVEFDNGEPESKEERAERVLDTLDNFIQLVNLKQAGKVDEDVIKTVVKQVLSEVQVEKPEGYDEKLAELEEKLQSSEKARTELESDKKQLEILAGIKKVIGE